MHMPTFIGLDAAKKSFAISFLVEGVPPAEWPVITIDYKDADWPAQLMYHLDEDAVIVCEPTGYNLTAPIANLIAHYTTASLWLINNQATGQIRDQHVSRTKTDAMDARALAWAASKIGTPDQPLSARPFDHAGESFTARLRIYIAAYARLNRLRTRYLNQLEIVGFSLWPAIAQHKSTWLNAVALNAISPLEIRRLSKNPPKGVSGNIMRHIDKLADKLPDIDTDPATRQAITDLYNGLAAIEPAKEEALKNLEAMIYNPQLLPVTLCWQSVPNSSSLAIATFHSATHCNVQRYTRNQFKAALGTNPQGKQSGSASKGKQKRSGYSPAAGAIHLWTMTLLKDAAPPNPLRDYFRRSKSPQAFAATRNKFASILWRIAINQEISKW